LNQGIYKIIYREKKLSLLYQLESTLIHTLVVLMIYTNMIFLMTYNIYIVLSIILGNGIGYYMFAFVKDKNLRINSSVGCCHCG
jgi:phage shock protein PspC (stress-responsive transcriptional regulator)